MINSYCASHITRSLSSGPRVAADLTHKTAARPLSRTTRDQARTVSAPTPAGVGRTRCPLAGREHAIRRLGRMSRASSDGEALRTVCAIGLPQPASLLSIAHGSR